MAEKLDSIMMDMKISLHWHQHDGNRVIHSSNTSWLCVCCLKNECNCVFLSKACFRERLETDKVQRATAEASPMDLLFLFTSCFYSFESLVSPWLYRVWRFYLHVLPAIVAQLHRHWWGSSGVGFFFRVSMMDWTLRFTLVVTRRVTESEDDGEEQVEDFWETRHFW